MNRKDSPQSVIDSYRKRQQMTPLIMGGLAVLLAVVGIIILVVWFTRPDASGVSQVGSLLATPTATITVTSTPTATNPPPTATNTATVTFTATITETPTPSGPFEYTVKEGDICWDLAVSNKVSVDVLLAINSFLPGTCPIQPGNIILIPLPDTELPTETPIAASDKGVIDYYVKTGETLAMIASKFNSTVEAIKTQNKIDDENAIQSGQLLKIPVNIVTPTPTKAATITNTPGGPTETAVSTPVPASATPRP
jgi:LysM repeat protein